MKQEGFIGGRKVEARETHDVRTPLNASEIVFPADSETGKFLLQKRTEYLTRLAAAEKDPTIAPHSEFMQDLYYKIQIIRYLLSRRIVNKEKIKAEFILVQNAEHIAFNEKCFESAFSVIQSYATHGSEKNDNISQEVLSTRPPAIKLPSDFVPSKPGEGYNTANPDGTAKMGGHSYQRPIPTEKTIEIKEAPQETQNNESGWYDQLRGADRTNGQWIDPAKKVLGHPTKNETERDTNTSNFQLDTQERAVRPYLEWRDPNLTALGLPTIHKTERDPDFAQSGTVGRDASSPKRTPDGKHFVTPGWNREYNQYGGRDTFSEKDLKEVEEKRRAERKNPPQKSMWGRIKSFFGS